MALVVILVSVLISLLLSRMLIRSVTSDFSRLIQKMKAFGRDESTPPDTGYDYSLGVQMRSGYCTTSLTIWP